MSGTPTLLPVDLTPRPISSRLPTWRLKALPEVKRWMSGSYQASSGSDTSGTLIPKTDTAEQKWKRPPLIDLEDIEYSATPKLKRGRSMSNNKMQGTPQPTLTQSKLTSLLQPITAGPAPLRTPMTSKQMAAGTPGDVPLLPPAPPAGSVQPTPMDTSGAVKVV